MDSIGADQERRRSRRAVCEGEFHGLRCLRDDVCEFALVPDLDATFLEHELELVNQNLSVHAESLVPVEMFVAKVIHVCRLVVLVFERQRFEVEPFVSNALVHANCVQNAKGVRGEHDGAALDEVVGADFPDGGRNPNFV